MHDACLCLHVQRAARALARRFDDAFRPLGITHGQFSLLMSLNRPTPARIGAIATLLAMDRTTLTANLKPLARRGLVQVSIDPDDRRSRMLALTPAGRKLLAAALPIWKRSHGELERKIANDVRSRPPAVGFARARVIDRARNVMPVTGMHVGHSKVSVMPVTSAGMTRSVSSRSRDPPPAPDYAARAPMRRNSASSANIGNPRMVK